MERAFICVGRPVCSVSAPDITLPSVALLDRNRRDVEWSASALQLRCAFHRTE